MNEPTQTDHSAFHERLRQWAKRKLPTYGMQPQWFSPDPLATIEVPTTQIIESFALSE